MFYFPIFKVVSHICFLLFSSIPTWKNINQVHFPYAPSQTPGWTHICFDNSFKMSIAKNSLKICNLNYLKAIIWPNSINIANLSRIEHRINQPIHKTCICIYMSLLWLHILSVYILTKACRHCKQHIWCRTASDAGKTWMDLVNTGEILPLTSLIVLARTANRDWSFMFFCHKGIDFINLHSDQYSSPHPSGSRINNISHRPTIPCQLPVRRSRSGDSPVLFSSKHAGRRRF